MESASASLFPSSSSPAASLAGRMPVRAPQAGVTPVSARAASKKLSFTARCFRRSSAYSSAAGEMPVCAVPRAVFPSTDSSVTADAVPPFTDSSTRAVLGSSPS